MPVAGHVQIGQAVVIEIGDCQASSPTARGQARGSGDVGKVKFRRVAILLVERDHRFPALQIGLECGVIHHGDVEFAIVVTVEERDAASRHRFHHVASFRCRVRHGSQAGTGSHVAEVHSGFRWHLRVKA